MIADKVKDYWDKEYVWVGDEDLPKNTLCEWGKDEILDSLPEFLEGMNEDAYTESIKLRAVSNNIYSAICEFMDLSKVEILISRKQTFGGDYAIVDKVLFLSNSD